MKVLFDKTKYTKWFITDLGNILSITEYNCKEPKLHIVRPNVHKRGYLYARTSNGNYQIHRLVALAFLDNKNNKPCVNHKDGNKHNNNLKNLEWVDYKENAQHAINHGLTKQMRKNEGNIKYTNEQCKDIIEMVNKGMKYKKAGEKYNMPYSTVAHLMRGSRRSI